MWQLYYVQKESLTIIQQRTWFVFCEVRMLVSACWKAVCIFWAENLNNTALIFWYSITLLWSCEKSKHSMIHFSVSLILLTDIILPLLMQGRVNISTELRWERVEHWQREGNRGFSNLTNKVEIKWKKQQNKTNMLES